ncbi:P-loop containing nucleoside triphosphate hydrolase protein [Epithele typhae]|uniref:P-loop containing nucleoside triphosphate hydrolase protein n=1 Tax=Epithele typhae TaxID=378194 RepID=UPI0020074466|nr:P-loop containing nucleoside triphosphate hydrolase protein [Epithele typhae]KAH9939337.1 P-loop containing nucleoside triphosphate hydrolase protein [Epithele typhae]
MRDHVDADAKPEDQEQGDADGEADEDERGGSGHSPKGLKRARVNAEGDSRPTGGTSKIERVTLPRDVDGYVPGSIVRIKLENFLTYDWVEFSPGPYLNMILGPNGTGKSSIACAICLGLNFPPALLNRAQDVKSFVKSDKEKGYIEIELKGERKKGNIVIRRTLEAANKKSNFFINDRKCSAADVSTEVERLNVQVNNLCTFLPQDRVAEFARMTPQQLLRETQRAAGSPNLSNWHDTLIGSGKELRQIQERVNEDREQLNNLEGRNAELQKQVKLYQERQTLEKRIELLSVIVPFTSYYEARDKYYAMKPVYRKITDDLKDMQARHAPYTAMQQALVEEVRKCEATRDALKRATKARVNAMTTKWAENDPLEREAESIKNRLDNLKKQDKQRQSDIKKYERMIDEGTKRLAEPLDMEDVEELTKQLKELNLKHRDIKERNFDIQEAQKQVAQKYGQCQAAVDGLTRQISQLDSVKHQKLQNLAKTESDAAAVVEWLRSNRHRFKMEVFEPAALSVNVPNRHYADAVEACFSFAQLRTFVCQCLEDYKTLNRVCVDTPEALGRTVRINTWYLPVDMNRLAPPPASPEDLRALGFDGYAIDFIDCPEGLKGYLYAEVKLHRTAIAVQNPRAVDGNRAMHMAEQANGANYIIGRLMNQVRRSNYGQRLAQNSTREIPQARSLVGTVVDPAVKRQLQEKLSESQSNMEVVRQEEQELAAKEKQVRADERDYRAEFGISGTEAEHVVSLVSPVLTLTVSAEEDKTKLDKLKKAPPVDQERARLKQQMLTLANKRVTLIRAYASLRRALITDYEAATKAGLEAAQVLAKKSALEVKCQEQKEELERATANWAEMRQKYTKAKEETLTRLQFSKDKLSESSDETKEKFKVMDEANEVVARSSEEWMAELAQCEEELNLNTCTNGGIVDQYNRRKVEIERLTETIEERERRAAHIDGQITAAREHWQPALERLVESIGKKFSGAFDRIGCAGEIRIREDEDYEKWAIDIMVKFRDSEKLQLLTGERQSGGERSLTTILYLMSLTEEARAPFSLVDEINQGMDQRAERAVHNALVEVTCQADSGQYFLITPKLLPDLRYHERMRILCVNNGEWLPDTDSPGMGNLNGLIDKFLFKRNGGQAAA